MWCCHYQNENAENTIKLGRMKGEELKALDEDEAAYQDIQQGDETYGGEILMKI